MLVILPFEKDFIKSIKSMRILMGHPLLGAISDLPPIDAEISKGKWF